MNNKKNLVLSLSAIILVAIILFAGGCTKEDKKDEQSKEQNKEQLDKQNNDFDTDVAFFEIETKHCKLYFPEKWEEQIEVKYTEEAGYKAEFYGLVENKEAQHLFDVCFNSDDGELLGYLENKDEIINISIDVMEPEFGNGWTQEEIDQIYSMQEELNFVMNTLGKNENYVEP